MAREEEVILGRNREGIAHEGSRVDDECSCHLAGNSGVAKISLDIQEEDFAIAWLLA